MRVSGPLSARLIALGSPRRPRRPIGWEAGGRYSSRLVSSTSGPSRRVAAGSALEPLAPRSTRGARRSHRIATRDSDRPARSRNEATPRGARDTAPRDTEPLGSRRRVML